MSAEPADISAWLASPHVLAELEAEAAEHDPRGTSIRWANATPEERERIVRDAADWRAGLVGSLERAGFASEAEYLTAMAPLNVPPSYAGPDEPWPAPEDRGTATLSPLGEVEYVEDLVRPGRIVVWAAEEGRGKSYTVDGELGIRVAVAGGSFAGTWPVLLTGPVLYLSEMHGDDDHARESAVLESLGLERSALAGRYFRLSLMTAAGGQPALMVAGWREWITGWLRDHGALLLIFDTATGATQVDPWGREIQAVFRDLRLMLDAYPALAVVLVVHVRKPSGRGERRLSDVLGEWGRWCDVVVMQENDGTSLERAKLTVRKRVRRERRIVATKAGGLLVDPAEPTATNVPQVSREKVLETITATPGMTYVELGAALGVSKNTAANYVKALRDQVATTASGPKGAFRVFPTAQPPNTIQHEAWAVPSAVPSVDAATDRTTAQPPIYRLGGVLGGEPPDSDDDA